jgi:hypothetical protein
MNVILCVASISSERIEGFLQEIENLIRTSNQDKVMVLGLGEPLESYHLDICHIADVYKQLDNRPRPYAEVIWEKLLFVAPYCNEDTVLLLADCDYSFNPNIFKFAKKIFFENPEVNYASFLKGPGVQPEEMVQLSGFPFFRSHSCMGGSMTVRWKTTFPVMQKFLLQKGLQGGFDQEFWDYLEEMMGEKDHVYTIWPYSLQQHCDLGSSYPENSHWHMYGENFDNRIDPLKNT